MSQPILEAGYELQTHSYVPGLLHRIVIPTFQREQSLEQIKEIKDYIISEVERGVAPLLGVLELCDLDGKYYLIDGQHRWEALRTHYDETKRMVPFPVMIYNVHNVDQMKRIFILRNKNLPVPDYIHNASEGKLELLKTIATELRKLSKLFVDRSANRPTVRISDLLERFRRSKYYEEVNTLGQFWEHFHQLNAKAYHYARDNQKTLKCTESMFEKCHREGGIYLGLDRNMTYYD